MIFIAILIAVSGYSQELQENFYNARALGMGNAFTAIGSDETAFWTNPAGVARNRKHRTRNFFQFHIPNLGFGMNDKAKDLYQGYKADTASGLAAVVADNASLSQNQTFWVNSHIFPVALWDYSRSNPSAFGIYNNTTAKMFVSEDAPDQALLESTADVGAIKSLIWTNHTNRISLGAQVRYISRYSLEGSYALDTMTDQTLLKERFKNSANKTTGLGIDIGGLFTMADYWFPTLGFAVFNLPTGCQEDYLNPHTKLRESVCGTKFSGDIGNPDALTNVDPTDIRIGLSITPRITRKLAMRIGLDAHHLYISSGTTTYGLSGVETSKMLHGGVELFIGNPLKIPPIAVRAGMNQGYATYGGSIRLPFMNLDFASYAVDVSSSTKQVEDRRYIMNLSFTL